MKIKEVIIEKWIERKIFRKHGISREELENAILLNTPRFFKAKEGRYMALTKYARYITIIFKYEKRNARIITAYPSSEWQKRLYNRK